MIYSLTTFSYRALKDVEADPTLKIYDLYVKSLVRLLKLFSYFLVFYCSSILVFRIIEVCSEGIPLDLKNQIVWATSVGMHCLGILVGVVGLRAVVLCSRGSSMNFFIAMVVFTVVYSFTQAYYLYQVNAEEDSNNFLMSILGKDHVFSALVYFLLITVFGLIFVSLKAHRFHVLLVELVSKIPTAMRIQSLHPIQESDNN